MLRIGLTGGIASGKSLVAREFAAHGAVLIDTDVIAREVVAPGTPGAVRLRAVFGDEIFAADGTVDRPLLREIVFSDPRRRHALETLLHPLIRARTLAALAASRGPYAVVAVPLLVETGFATQVDRVLLVTCRRDQQIARLMARDELDRVHAEAMIDAQASGTARLAAADDILDNSGPVEATLEQVRGLHSRYLAFGDNCRTRPAHAE